MMVLTAADGHRLQAYESVPAGAARGGVVVVQEIFGVNDHIRRVADGYAADGYRVIAPALFDRVRPGIELGYTDADIAEGRKIRGQLSFEQALADVEAARKALGDGNIGIVGYCWGGTVAWHGATRTSDFAASVGWYGGGIAAARDEKPHCPVQLHFGEKDASIPMSDVEAVRAARPEVEVFVYRGAGHGFGCEERGSYVPADAALAQERTLAFFAKHLG
jgi:carboxymethylenebutenolidase